MKKETRYTGFDQKSTPHLSFSLNKLTHSKTRYALFRELYDEEQDIQLGGVTTEWLAAAHQAMNKIESSARAITTPSLVLSADDDAIIDNNRQRRVAQLMPNAKLEIVPRAYHELFTESDDIRERSVARILDFLTEDPST